MYCKIFECVKETMDAKKGFTYPDRWINSVTIEIRDNSEAVRTHNSEYFKEV